MKILMCAGMALAVLAAAAAPAAADTVVLASPDGHSGLGTNSSLLSVGGILDSIYGLSNLTRVSDTVDQLWTLDATASGASAQAAYAGYTNTFGTIAGATGSNLPLSTIAFTVAGTNQTNLGIAGGTLAHNIAETALLQSGPFRLGLDPNGGADPGSFSSLASENEDGIDHMVTFRWVDPAGNVRYIVCFEDLQGGGDRDYNDLVIELIGVTPVPEPGTLVLLGTGALGLFAASRRRKSAVKAA